MADSRAWICPIVIDGYEAVVEFDLVTGLYQGKFLGLNGQADFCATGEGQMLVEGRRSLTKFLDECGRRGIAPKEQV